LSGKFAGLRNMFLRMPDEFGNEKNQQRYGPVDVETEKQLL
jgi:hypothetical protein